MNIRELAYRNVTRNRRTYSAYFLSSAFAIMAFFVYSFFAFHPALSAGELGQYVFVSMSFAQSIIYLFTFFFILYSMGMFLKTRKRELGILMMLGMTKYQLKRLIFFENIMIGIGAIIFWYSFRYVIFRGITICRPDDIKTRYLLILLHTDESNCCNKYYVFHIIYDHIIV